MAKPSPLTAQASADVEALAQRCRELAPDTLPLDHSFESLDRIEVFLRAHRDELARVASYIGQTLIAHAGGKWEAAKANRDQNPEPLVTKLTECAKARFYPSEVADKALHWNVAVIRDAVERYDLAGRRQRLAWCLEHLDEQMTQLRGDVERLIGRPLSSLDDLEDAVIAAERLDRDQRRLALERMAIYYGELTRERVGGEWTVDANYQGLDFGEFQVNGITPAHTLANVGPDSRGLTRRMLDMIVAARKNTPEHDETDLDGAWEAYCSSKRAITLAELKSRLSPEFTTTRLEGDKLIASPHDAPKCKIEVTIERGAEVTAHAGELADLDVVLDPGVPEPDREALRACDERYVIAFAPDDYDRVYNTLQTIAPTLEQQCGAIIFDATNERFV